MTIKLTQSAHFQNSPKMVIYVSTFFFDAGTKVRTERQDIKLKRNVAYEIPKPQYNMKKNEAYEVASLRA